MLNEICLLTLAVFETENVAFWEIKGVLEGLEGENELLQLHVLVKKDVLHFAAVLRLESIHLLLFCSVWIRIRLLLELHY